jgi:serine/threonine protein kinase
MTVYSTTLSSSTSAIIKKCLVAHSPYLVNFHTIVTCKDLNRGILLRYVSSKSLENIQLTPSEKYTVIGLLLTALSDLEERGYYPQDLKLSNILFSDDKWVLHIVDLGSGVTEGMDQVKSLRSILQDKMNWQDMCYTFGKTVSDLYSFDDFKESPNESSGELSVESIPDLIQKMILGCCGNEMDTEKRVKDVRSEYSDLLENAASQEWKRRL